MYTCNQALAAQDIAETELFNKAEELHSAYAHINTYMYIYIYIYIYMYAGTICTRHSRNRTNQQG